MKTEVTVFSSPRPRFVPPPAPHAVPIATRPILAPPAPPKQAPPAPPAPTYRERIEAQERADAERETRVFLGACRIRQYLIPVPAGRERDYPGREEIPQVCDVATRALRLAYPSELGFMHYADNAPKTGPVYAPRGDWTRNTQRAKNTRVCFSRG